MQHNTFLTALRNRIVPYCILFAVTAALFLCNYTPGTFLSGWDNLHTEFDSATNIVDRSVFSTWQEYQGLGVRAGNAHAADLLRQLGIFAVAQVLPLHLVRYSYHFLALFIGSLGVFELITCIFSQHKKRWDPRIYATIGGLFSLLNLGTMQYFSIPYEAFSHFFASLPFLILFTLRYLQHQTKRRAFHLVLILILATPSFYIPTLFIVYCMVLGAMSLWFIFRKRTIQPVLATVGMTIAVNAFWLFPFLAFLAHGTAFVGNTKINAMFTQEAFLRNSEFGTPKDIALLRGFLFDTTDLSTDATTHAFIMQQWIQYLSHPLPQFAGYILFLLAVVGYGFACFKRRPYVTLFLGLFLFVLFVLFADNPPTGWLFRLFQDYIPLFKQVFRFPYTKFLPLAVLTYAVGIAYGISFLESVSKKIRYPVIACIVVLLATLSIPSFSGSFIYKNMKVNIPKEYFSVFTYFQTHEDSGRIANLPQPTYWGWTTYDWGYRGSGFPWYGIPQPILDRAFDVWNTTNEVYWNELTHALYIDGSSNSLQNVFQKYGVRYVWLDGRVILPGSPQLLNIAETKRMLVSISECRNVFTEGKQTIYRCDWKNDTTSLSIESLQTPQFPFSSSVLQNDLIQQSKTETILPLEVPHAGTMVFPSFIDSAIPFIATVWKTDTTIEIHPVVSSVSINGKSIPLQSASIHIPLPKNTPYVFYEGTEISSKPQEMVIDPKKQYISVFTSRGLLKTNVTPAISTLPLQNCSTDPASKNTTFAISANNPFTLSGSLSIPCLYAPLSSLISLNPKTKILNVSYDYRTSSEKPPTICLTKEGDQSCFFQTQQGIPSQKNTWTSKHETILLPDSPTPVWFKIQTDYSTAVSPVQTTLRNITITQILADEEQLTIAYPEQQAVQVNIPENSHISIHVPSSTSQTLSIAQNTPAKNCDSLAKGPFSRTVRTDSVPSYVRFDAYQSSSCDWRELPDLSNGALVTVSTRNISGRPIKVCIKKYPETFCVFERILPGKKNIWTTYSIPIPPSHSEEKAQYFLELDNFAVGNEHRTNDIGEITIQPLPIDWIESLLFIPANNSSLSPENFRSLGEYTSHPNPTIYTVRIPTDITLPQRLVLPQSYDTGWIAFQISNGSITVLQRSPASNNWANGFLLRPNTSGLRTDKGEIRGSTSERSIVIFFLPQTLEWIGFLLGGGVLIAPIYLHFFQKKGRIDTV